jgi:serine/threonine-protein phosphatase 2B catalytic subunit
VGDAAPLVGYRLTVLTICSEESERVSKLKSISGSSRLPYGTLTLGAEGIKNAIKTFDDACAPFYLFYVYCTD